MIDLELEHRYAEPNGCRIHYVARGEGTAARLHARLSAVLVPVAPAARRPRRRPRRIRAGHARLQPLRPPAGVEAYRMRHLLGDIRGLVEQLGIAPFTLVGHDWGGIVSWAFALKYPELLHRLVIIDSPPPFTWNRDLRESPKQREAVNYMLELSAPSPQPEEMLAAGDFAMLDSHARAGRRYGGPALGRGARRLPRGLVPARRSAGRAQLLPGGAHGRAGRRRWSRRRVRGEDQVACSWRCRRW